MLTETFVIFRRQMRILLRNPVVDATRVLFAGDFGDRYVWIGALVTVALGALLGYRGTRTFQRRSA